MSGSGEFRLVARSARAIKTPTGPLPGQGWRRSDMTDRCGYSVEITLTRDDEGAALYLNCREALEVEVTSFETDPEGALALQLEGLRGFATRANGRLRAIGGLPGHETDSLVDGQFGGDLFVLSRGLVWQASAVSEVEEEIARMLAFAETQVLTQFLETGTA